MPSYLSERLTLLRYFSQYMDENLTEGGDSQAAGHLAPARRPSAAPFVHMKRWVRTPKAIIMQLDNSTLQVTIRIRFRPANEPETDTQRHPLSGSF